MVGTMTITPVLQLHVADRDDYLVRVEGPEPSTPPMDVPMSFTGTVVAMWGVGSREAAEEIARTIFGGGAAVIGTRGTASGFPPQGYWFDSYNSAKTLQETINKILNEGDLPFIKNRSASGLYGLLVGQETGEILGKIDQFFNEKFGMDFFKKLDEVFALSEIADTLTDPPKDKANFIYKVCLLSCIVDAIYVRLPDEKGFRCDVCNRASVGSIEALKNWLAVKLGESKADKLVEPLKMVKNIRNQFPIHNHYELKNGVRVAKETVVSATAFFGIDETRMDYVAQWHRVLVKFNASILDIIAVFKSLQD